MVQTVLLAVMNAGGLIWAWHLIPDPVGMILQGRGAMPPLGDLLSPAQIAAVVSYVRTHFGNNYRTPVKEADVKAMMGL